jgi:hypothetical protein
MPVTLDDVLFNRKPEPFTLRALFAYLDSKMATELLDFWVAALDARNMFEPEHPRSSYSMNKWELQEDVALPEDPEKLETLTASRRVTLEGREKTKEDLKRRHTESQILMRVTYVDDDAPLCINISEEQRNAIIARCPKSPDDPPCPGLYDEAMKECEHMIETNYFKLFFRLAEEHAKVRQTLPPPVPPPKPRQSRILKGQILTKDEIAALVPKEPPPEDY